MEGEEWRPWEGNHWTATPQWQQRGYGRWSRGSWADQWEDEHGDYIADQPQAKHRRHDESNEQQQAADEAAQAAAQQQLQLQQQQQAAAAQQYAAHIAAVVARAIDAGVQPLTDDGQDLCVLDAQRLAAWVATHLDGEQ